MTIDDQESKQNKIDDCNIKMFFWLLLLQKYQNQCHISFEALNR